MTASPERISGGCLCGAVRFSAAPKSFDYGLCHCDMCRKWTSGPFFAIDCGTSAEIENEASLGSYRSSDWARREFCQQCGTTLFYHMPDTGLRIASVGAFDDTSAFNMVSEIFVDEQPAHYSFANQTRRLTGPEVLAKYAAEQDT